MERIGEKLRRRREELGFTIDDIARATKYRPDVIQAVEEGRTGVFPAEAYRQAFLRAYADKLGLDPAEVVREQKSEEERVYEALKGIRLKPRTGPGLRRTLVWLAVVVGVAAAFLVLYDRVIKVRGLREPAEGAGFHRIGAAESTQAGRPDSQVVAPSDSTGMGAEGMRGGQGEGPGPGGGPEQTGASGGVREEVAEVVSAPVLGKEPDVGAGGDAAAGDGRPDEGRELARAEAGGPGGPEGRDWLAVSVSGYAVRARLRAGDSILVNRWLRSDFCDTFYSSEPFWADTIITSENSMSLVLNGEKVDLPDAGDNVITDFRISP